MRPNLIRSSGSTSLEDFRDALLGLGVHGRAEADARLLGAVLDHLLEAIEGAAADEQDVGGVDLQEVLVRVLAPALRRNARHRSFDQLQQRLLHALARDVARDRRVVRLPADLVDLVDVDDAALRLLDVVAAVLEQLLDDVLDVLADVARLGQRRRVGDDERHVEQARERLREQRLARAGRPDQQDVALRELDLVLGAAHVLEPLVVVVDRDRERPLGDLLADHVLVEARLDLARDRQVGLRRLRIGRIDRHLVADDVVAELDALVADEHRRAGDQLLDLVLALAAERAVENLLARGTFFLGHGRREKAAAGDPRPIIVEKKTPPGRGERPPSACCCPPTRRLR